MKDTVILKTHELRKVFGSIRAVDGVSIRIPRGQVYGFLGPNGSGKTTTIGMILGLLHPTSGTVSLFGERVTPFQIGSLRRVGALISAPALLSSWLLVKKHVSSILGKLHLADRTQAAVYAWREGIVHRDP